MTESDNRKFCELIDIYNSPWGVLGKFRAEAERAPFGHFHKVFKKAIEDQFFDTKQLMKYLNCSMSKARRSTGDVRIVILDKKHWYLKEDVFKFLKPIEKSLKK